MFSPVTGTVVKVKKYLLYGKWDDYELHIRPDGYPDLDIVMIHVTDVSAKPGDRVQAGETRIAAVRKVSDKFYVQLSSYTKGGGNHVHLQVNDATDPKYKGLEGAIDPDAAPACRRARLDYSCARAFNKPAEAAVELRANEHHAPLAPEALQADVGTHAHDLPLVGATGVLLLELHHVAERHGCDRVPPCLPLACLLLAAEHSKAPRAASPAV